MESDNSIILTTDWTFTWSNGRQLTGASATGKTLSYTYGVDGIRDSKTYNGTTYSYLNQNGQVVRQSWGTNKIDFIYDNNGRPASMVYNGTTYYYVLNLQGDVIQIVTASGESKADYTYDAWGRVLTATGELASVNPLRYRGYYYDTETGLYYLGNRYYDPVVKRFINADSAGLITVNSYGLTDKNYFSYCDNNPVSRKDDGGKLWNLVVGAVVGGLIGGISTAIECVQSGESIRSTVAQIAISATCGAIGGAIAGSGLGTIGQGVTGAVLGGIESYGRQRVSSNTKGEVSVKQMAVATVSGALGGLVSGKGASNGSKYMAYQKTEHYLG